MLFNYAPFIILLKCFIAKKYKMPRLVKYKIAENFRFYNLLVLEGKIENRPLNLDLHTGDFNLHHISLEYIEDTSIRRLCNSYGLFSNHFQSLFLKLSNDDRSYIIRHKENKLKELNNLPEFMRDDISDYIYQKEKRKSRFELKKEIINYNTILNFTKNCKYQEDFFQKELIRHKNIIDELSKKLNISIPNLDNPKTNNKDKCLYDAFFGKDFVGLFAVDKLSEEGYSKKIFDIILHQMTKRILSNDIIKYIRRCDLDTSGTSRQVLKKEKLKEDPKYGEFYDEIIDLINRMKKK